MKKCSPGPENTQNTITIIIHLRKERKSVKKLLKVKKVRFSIIRHLGRLPTSVFIWAKSSGDLFWIFIENHDFLKFHDFHHFPSSCPRHVIFLYKTNTILSIFNVKTENHGNSWNPTFSDHAKILYKSNEIYMNSIEFPWKLKTVNFTNFPHHAILLIKPVIFYVFWGPDAHIFAKMQENLENVSPKTSPSRIYIYAKSSAPIFM